MANSGEQDSTRTARYMLESNADEMVSLTKTIGPPGDNMLSRFQEDVMENIRTRLESVDQPAEARVTIEVTEVDE